jgi:hypothetical protein
MIARSESRCLLCIGANKKDAQIYKGDSISPHPTVNGKWVHSHHIKQKDTSHLDWLNNWEITKERF